jgi:hypothetical protein
MKKDREQQDVIILGADEGVDRQDAVATGSVLDPIGLPE